MSWKFRVMANVKEKNALIYILLLLTVLCASTFAQAPTKKALKKVKGAESATSTTTTTTTSSSTTSSTTAKATTTQLEPLKPVSTEANDGVSGSTASSMPEICLHGLKAVIVNSGEDEGQQQTVRTEAEFVQVTQGAAMLSVFTTDPTSAIFVVNRINDGNLIEADFEIGLRAIEIDNESILESLLIQEVQYLQQCITHAIGIFMDYDLYTNAEDIIKDLEYNIWVIPSPRVYIFPKVAHLLYQMPWGENIASVEILSESLNIYNEFMEAVRHENMCLMHFRSEDNIYILFGNKMASHFKENGTIFAVPTELAQHGFLGELPDKAYILMEDELDMHMLEQNGTQLSENDVLLLGKSVLPSRVLAFAQSLLDLMRWLKDSLTRNCKRDDNLFVLASCLKFLTFIDDWQKPEYRQLYEPAKILDLLGMHAQAKLMNFQVLQKRATGGGELHEIASQNFITNVTTYYHYNRDNKTSVELKKKFGQVFNCQYINNGDNNKRYPFLFEGESVMFWRIKPDAWVATGMTAAILGVIITMAILVFIVVRISLGDVFEGNPVTSILLLLSLILLFTSFIPFSMEYVGEHPNSNVTFEDAATLNTLCAVRVFIMSLVYCFAFSLLLCRAVMLASIGSEGGFLSHVNGYIQAVICIFSVFVQLGMSVQLLVIMHVAKDSISCEPMYYGSWLWVLISYDLMLLLCVVGLVPFIYRSQRNYREGILIVIGAVLSFITWLVWIVVSLFGDEMRDAAIPLGLQATGWSILIGVLIPRTFLIVRGIERSDIAQALPSLTSLAFAQNNQYSSEQSVYECVNPAMRNCSQEEMHQSPSEIPTLPLRGGGPRRQQFFANLRQANANINPQRPPPRPQRVSPTPNSSQSSLPETPENSKITRF